MGGEITYFKEIIGFEYILGGKARKGVYIHTSSLAKGDDVSFFTLCGPSRLLLNSH
jgi:restriction endonuclease Mrr